MKIAKLLPWISLLVLIAVIPACTSSNGKVKVAIVTNNADNWWNIAEAGARKAEAELGNVEVLFRRPPVANAAEQKKIIDALVDSGVKGIAISVIDPLNQSDALSAIADRVPVITMDNDAPASKRICYVGTNNYEAGKAVGQLVKEAMPEGGTIAIFVGQIEPLNARERFQGVCDELAGQKDAKGPVYGKYTLHTDAAITDGKDDKVAVDKAKTTLAALRAEADAGKLAMIGLWAYNPPAILSAVKGEGLEKKVKIVGFDENTVTLQAIQDGDIYGTVAQSPFQFGYQSVKILVDIHNGKKDEVAKEALKFAEHQVITKDGGEMRRKADEFAKELEEMTKSK